MDGKLWIVVSDYGNFAHPFHFSSGTLKQFLCTTNSDYLCRKFLTPKERYEVDWEATVKVIKKTILEQRRNKDISENDARNWFNSFDYIESEEEYKFEYDAFPEWYEYIIEKETSQSINLKKYVIEPLLELFKKQEGK